LEQVKRFRRKVKILTWDLLEDIAHQISEERFGDVRAKYQANLYLQRQEVKTAFDAFLASDKTGFLLLGKSGVGKSSFFISLVEAYRTEQHICVLPYNGATLAADHPLVDILKRDFARHIRFMDGDQEIGISDLLLSLGQIKGIEETHVIVFIDAVNENTDAKGLLQQIDALVAVNPYPWFKVVFSSRPEAWRAMKRGLKLSEHRYYRTAGQSELGVELQPFSFDAANQPLGIQMYPFNRQELPEVYAKYQTVYHLQTSYNELPLDIRHLLNDPLTLKLVATIYHQKAIPTSIQPGEIYQQYMNQLVNDGRLRQEDWRFLEYTLLPLMIEDSHYGKMITDEQINTTLVDVDHSLFDLVFNNDRLPNGQQINQAFINLADAEVLAIRGTPMDYSVEFKYERFYDYFGGKRLYQLAANQRDQRNYYRELIQATLVKPFLWGPVKSALIQEAKNQGAELVLELCYTEDQRTKEILVQVLTEVGHDKSDAVIHILERLSPDFSEPNQLRRIYNLIRPPRITINRSTYSSYKIAIEVASNLNINCILQAAARHPDASVRTSAVRFSYYLWKRDPSAGLAVVQDLGSHAIHGVIPDLAAVEAVLGLSVIMFMEKMWHPLSDTTSLQQLRYVWRELIDQVFGLKGAGGLLNRISHGFIRDRVFTLLINQVFRLIQELPSYSLMNYADAAAFFTTTPDSRSLYKRLTAYLDIKGSYNQYLRQIQGARRDLDKLIRIRAREWREIK